MPFKSEKQRKWMHANRPQMAKRWEQEEKRRRSSKRSGGSQGSRKRKKR